MASASYTNSKLSLLKSFVDNIITYQLRFASIQSVIIKMLIITI